jgi:hypothetical protein
MKAQAPGWIAVLQARALIRLASRLKMLHSLLMKKFGAMSLILCTRRALMPSRNVSGANFISIAKSKVEWDI